MRYSTILFDVGDTLLRVPDPAPYYQTLLSQHGVDVGIEHMRRILEQTRCKMDECIPRWVGDDFVLDREASAERRALHVETVIALAGIEDQSAARDAFFSIYTGTDFFTIYPEVRTTLAALRALGYRLGVVSNWETRLPDLCAAHGIDTYLDFAVISEVEGYAKPHPHLYRRALELAQTSADRVVHVGDKLKEDVEGAAQIGIRGILIDRGKPPSTDFSPQIASLADLIPLLAAT